MQSEVGNGIFLKGADQHGQEEMRNGVANQGMAASGMDVVTLMYLVLMMIPRHYAMRWSILKNWPSWICLLAMAERLISTRARVERMVP